MKNILFFASLALAVLMISCSENKETGNQKPDELILHVDSTVKPGQDFFMYANGKWFKQNPIPESEQSNGIWRLIQDTVNAQILRICKSASTLQNPEKGSLKQKIGDFYFSGMDSATINKKSIEDLKSYFGMIDDVKDAKGIVQCAAYIHSVSGSPLFGFYVGQDDRISSKNAIFLSQGGLSLPDRAYYFDNDSRAKMIREKFIAHLENAFKIMGYDNKKAKLSAENFMKLETDIAKASRKREDTRDPLKNYNKISYNKLKESVPGLDWDVFTSNVGLKNIDTVIVGQPEFLKSISGLLKSYKTEDWKNYLKYHLMRGVSRYMDDKTYLEFFSFYTSVLRGVKVPKPRWKRVVEQTDASLGELIGQVYIKEYLPSGTKEKLTEIGNAIRLIFAERINKLDWMSDATKKKALSKLNKIIMKVGYPDKWKDMSSLALDRTSYLKNAMNANKWGFNYMTSKYGKPVDRTEWSMEPQTYNAYYNPSNNEIVVPGCNIIVPGYESKMADDAILYAIIGSTFGHEMTHGFDDQGCKYDESGNLNNWWAPADSANFFKRTKMVVKQFNKYIAVDSLHINGELTQGENIADLGGTIMAYEAFLKTEQYKNKENIAGYNPVQRFFLGYALGWMVNERPESIANQVKSNEHSPAKFRVNGPLSDMPEFYEAFGVKQGDALWLPDSLRVRIW